MKRIARNIALICLMMSTTAMFIGCEPESYVEETEEKEIDEGNTGGSGDEGKDDPDTPSDVTDGSEIDVSAFEKYEATFTSCLYESFGSTDSVDGYIFLLADDDYDWESQEGEGSWAIVELFTKAGAGIAEGKYCVSDSAEAGTAYLCEIGDETVSGAMYGIGEYAYVCPNAGYVEISKKGEKYTIKIKYIDETFEGLFEGSFTGTLEEYESGSGEEEGGDYTDDFTQCEAEFYGEYDGVGDWGIYLGDDDTDMSDLSGGAWAMIELFSSSTTYTSSLPTGTFEINDSEEAGTVASIYDDGTYCYGTMYGIDAYYYVGATAGTVKISKSGSTYTIEMNFIDEDYDSTFTSTYTGKVTISDCSEDYESSIARAPKSSSKRIKSGLPVFKVASR